MSHTPGPWTADRLGQVWGESGRKGCRIADVGGFSPPEIDANAALIAAAPRLLEELKAMVARFSGYQGMELTTAKEAIAQAEGRGIHEERTSE